MTAVLVCLRPPAGHAAISSDAFFRLANLAEAAEAAEHVCDERCLRTHMLAWAERGEIRVVSRPAPPPPLADELERLYPRTDFGEIPPATWAAPREFNEVLDPPARPSTIAERAQHAQQLGSAVVAPYGPLPDDLAGPGCMVPDCWETEYRDGLCQAHYWELFPPLVRTPKTCTETGCDEPLVARGRCAHHYHRLKNHGGLPPRPSVRERFWARVTKIEGGCWLWMGALAADGYGRYGVARTSISVQRYAYEVTHGYLLPGEVLGKDPGCPRVCVHPDHWRVTTRRELSQQPRGGIVTLTDKARAARAQADAHPADEALAALAAAYESAEAALARAQLDELRDEPVLDGLPSPVEAGYPEEIHIRSEN